MAQSFPAYCNAMKTGHAGGFIPLILALQRLRQEDCHKFKASLFYIENFLKCSVKKKTCKN